MSLASFGTAWATTTSTINVGGTDYTLFTGFTATGGTEGIGVFVYGNMVDGDTSTSFHVFTSPAYVEFNSEDPIIPKGYIFNTYDASSFKPTGWVLKAKANTADEWTTLSSKSESLASGQEFQYACDNSGNNAYKYFRFEVSNNSNNIWLTEIRLYGSSPDFYYTHLTGKAATCTETGIKQDCYLRNDGKYFTDETGETELEESDVIEPIIAHTCEHHEATDVNIEYWKCSMCGKYFSDEACTTEITEEETKIYRAITIDNAISGLVIRGVEKALTGETVTLTVSHLIDASTLKVNNGSVTLTDAGDRTYTFTVPAADVTVTASILSTYSVTLPANMVIVSATNEADDSGKYISGTVVTFAASLGYAAANVSDGTNTLDPDAYGNYTVTVAEADINITANTENSSTLYLSGVASDFTAVDGNILIGSTSHTVTIADNAKITLNNATISGGIVCEGSATITLVGENSVSNTRYSSAGIQIGDSGTTLTIKGDGSLSATGGSQAAGIGLGRTWDANATGGSIVIEGGTITANGNNGIGTGTVGNGMTATVGDIVIKGGTVNARLGKGTINYGSTAAIGAIKIYDTIDKVDASAITESVTYMHDETDVTASASTYFTIIEDGDRRVITPKDDTDYTITIDGNTEHGTITYAAKTAKYGDKITITAAPDFGYRLSRLVVKDAQNNDIESRGNSFFMPKSNVTVSAVFEQGTHGTTEFALAHWNPNQDWVTDATIYDGVTTVNIQNNGESYSIIKFYEYDYSQFLLDNDTYDVNIPYAGGTGTFQNGNPTDFNLNYDATAGFYDITMTDAGDGKWSVSILKTVPQMDAIPDQDYNYTGSEITPEPLVLAGSLNLTKGTDYEYSYENNTDIGTAKVTVTFKGDYVSLGSVEKEFNIINNPYDITISEGLTNGTVTANPTQAIIGTPITLTVKAGYEAKNVSVKNGDTVITVTANADGTYSFTMPAGAVTVEAEITPISYTITYELDGGTVETANPATYMVEDAITLNNPTKDGYTFTGWTGTGLDEATITATIPEGSTGDREYTATWKKKVFTPKDSGTPEFAFHSLLLSGQIGVLFHVYAPAGASSNDYCVYFDVSGDKSQNTQPVYPFETITEDGYDFFGFKCFINSVQMADNIHAVLHYKDANETNQIMTHDYTAKAYLEALSNDTAQPDDALELGRAIMDYGSYVQPVLADYNGWSIDVKHAKMTPAYDYTVDDFTSTDNATKDYAIICERPNDSGIGDVKFALLLDSETTIELLLVSKSDYSGNVYAYIGTNKTDNMAVKSGNDYTVSIGNISAHKLADTYTVEVVTKYPEAESSVSFTVSVSALSYVQSAIHNDSTAMKKAVTSLYRYYDATMTYRNNRPNIY